MVSPRLTRLLFPLIFLTDIFLVNAIYYCVLIFLSPFFLFLQDCRATALYDERNGCFSHPSNGEPSFLGQDDLVFGFRNARAILPIQSITLHFHVLPLFFPFDALSSVTPAKMKPFLGN